MYRRKNKCCCCQKMNNKTDNVNMTDVLEDICDDVATLSEQYSNDNDSCCCGFGEEMSAFPDNAVLGQSYVPFQYMNETFKPCVGLKMGTIFPELVSPYVPCQSVEEIEFIKATNKIGKGCNK